MKTSTTTGVLVLTTLLHALQISQHQALTKIELLQMQKSQNFILNHEYVFPDTTQTRAQRPLTELYRAKYMMV